MNRTGPSSNEGVRQYLASEQVRLDRYIASEQARVDRYLTVEPTDRARVEAYMNNERSRVTEHLNMINNMAARGLDPSRIRTGYEPGFGRTGYEPGYGRTGVGVPRDDDHAETVLRISVVGLLIMAICARSL